MSAPPPNYSGTPGQQPYYDEKSQYGPGQFSPPPQQQQQQQQFPPPPHQQSFPPPPTQQQYGSPAPQQQYPPPPGPPQQGGQQQYYPPPPQTPQTPQQYPSPSQSQKQYPPPPGPPPSQQPPSGYAQQAPPPAPPFTQSSGTVSTVADTVGTFDGGSFKIDHRDCNTILAINLARLAVITAKPGAMVAMSPTVTLKGNVKFQMKKLLTGGEITHSSYTGPGEVVLAPPSLGDIIPIRLDGQSAWSAGKDAILAATQNVKKDMKAQGLGKAMFSGEGLFLYKISGHGIVWITSLGAIITKHLGDREEYIVDNDHLVAWNCKYTMERVASGGFVSSFAASEGLVCRFTGPGTVFIQTRNPTAFGQWIASHISRGGSGGGSVLGSFLS